MGLSSYPGAIRERLRIPGRVERLSGRFAEPDHVGELLDAGGCGRLLGDARGG